MRHRIGIASWTGLGNPSKELMDNRGKLTPNMKKMFREAWKNFPLMKKRQGCDYQIKKDEIRFGIEPAYMYNPVEMITLRKDKKYSSKLLGYSWGAYGSGIAGTTRYYKDYKYKSKFVRFIDKWHKIIWTKKK